VGLRGLGNRSGLSRILPVEGVGAGPRLGFKVLVAVGEHMVGQRAHMALPDWGQAR